MYYDIISGIFSLNVILLVTLIINQHVFGHCLPKTGKKPGQYVVYDQEYAHGFFCFTEIET